MDLLYTDEKENSINQNIKDSEKQNEIHLLPPGDRKIHTNVNVQV